MFDLVRKHTKVLMILMFLLIIPAFVLVGVDGYSRFNDPAQSVARVGGHDITQAEWDNAHRQDVERIRQSAPTIDAALLDSPQAKYAALERLVRERVMAEAATRQNLTTSDARLARELQQNPSIAGLRKPDGTLDMERYRQLVASQGMTPEMFEARVRRDLSLRQVEVGVTATPLVVPAIADVSLGAFFEQREVEVARFTADSFKAKVSLSDADLETYYKANAAAFAAPESVDIEYVVFDLDSLKAGVALNEADVKTYYEQNVSRLSGTEERRASHILISAPKDMAADARQKAKAKAQEVLAEVRKSPDKFAELAKKYSADKGSAASGGDLDFFTRGAMVKPFEEAAFAMKKGDISDLVESEFGYHIIRLTDLKSPKPKTFEEMRAGIEADLKAQQAQRRFTENADAFMDAVYSQFDSLKPVADKYKLEIRTAKDVPRTPVAGATGVLANPKLLAAIYENDTLNAKRNTKAIETGASQLVSARVAKHTPARTKSFAEVRDAVRERLTAVRSVELARAAGQARLAEWKAKPAAPAADASKATVSRDQPQSLEPQALEAAMKADPTQLPSFAGVSLGDQGYAVVKVARVIPRTAPAPAQQRQAEVQVTQMWAAAESQALYRVLKDRYKTRINVADPNVASAAAPDTAAAR